MPFCEKIFSINSSCTYSSCSPEELAVKVGSEEADLAVSDVITEDTKKYLKNFEDKVAQLEKFTQDSIKDYNNHDVKLKEDLKTLGKSKQIG